MNRRVVITGLGVIASNGIGKDAFWKANIQGKTGFNLIRKFDTSQFRTKMAAEVLDFDLCDYFDEIESDKIDRCAQFAIACAQMAVKDSNLILEKEDSYRVGVSMGSGLGGMFFYEKQILTMQKYGHSKTHPASITRVMPNAPAGHVAIEMHCKGPNLTISTACASGTHAIGQAYEFIKQNKAEVILAGGTESPIVYYNFAGFDAMHVMSANNENYQEACCPFDRSRDGFVMGEGAGILILEELEHALKRNARIYAEVVGYSLTSGAKHMVMPIEDGEDAAETIFFALKEAKLKSSQVDYINAHGTATQANDKAETSAIKKVFGKYAYKIPVSSTKSMIGHTFGAAGAIEAIICCLSIENNIVPPTMNYKNSDPLCDLDYVPHEARQHKVDVAVSNSFAFGGNNTVLILRRVRS